MFLFRFVHIVSMQRPNSICAHLNCVLVTDFVCSPYYVHVCGSVFDATVPTPAGTVGEHTADVI